MAIELDASTFQRQLETLAEVLAQKLRREAPKLLGATPGYVSVDLHVILRQMIYTYNLFFYLNADERVENDPYYRKQYSFVMLPLLRNMIDSLYNITGGWPTFNNVCLRRPTEGAPSLRFLQGWAAMLRVLFDLRSGLRDQAYLALYVPAPEAAGL
jgi:hypothetical protein